jgi:hypothetical protein
MAVEIALGVAEVVKVVMLATQVTGKAWRWQRRSRAAAHLLLVHHHLDDLLVLDDLLPQLQQLRGREAGWQRAHRIVHARDRPRHRQEVTEGDLAGGCPPVNVLNRVLQGGILRWAGLGGSRRVGGLVLITHLDAGLLCKILGTVGKALQTIRHCAKHLGAERVLRQQAQTWRRRPAGSRQRSHGRGQRPEARFRASSSASHDGRAAALRHEGTVAAGQAEQHFCSWASEVLARTWKGCGVV